MAEIRLRPVRNWDNNLSKQIIKIVQGQIEGASHGHKIESAEICAHGVAYGDGILEAFSERFWLLLSVNTCTWVNGVVITNKPTKNQEKLVKKSLS